MARRNPAKFERCVKAVKKRGGAANAYAVCTAAGTRRKNAPRKKSRRIKNLLPLADVATAGQYAEKGREYLAKQFKRKGKKKNPADESQQAYEDFHGRPSDETVIVEQKLHYHKNLAAAGELEALVILPDAGGRPITLAEFGNAILAFNEARTQLFIVGGDQSVDLGEFGIDSPHEKELLGEVAQVGYFTTKDHLGDEGGEAIYQHEFEDPLPKLVYDVRNKQLEFVGGNYVILPEGIDQ